MQQDNSSFWTDIKVLEEMLANDPDSYCFARLSEIYLKVGLLDDALHTVRKGMAKHPRYLAGQRALAMACHAKGLSGESLEALKLVTEVTPEDLDSQKLFGRLSIELGDHVAAAQAFRTALQFAPEDLECRLELDALVRPETPADPSLSGYEEDEEEILDDLEIIEDIEICEDDEEEQQESSLKESASFESPLSEPLPDPLSTATLAELYVSQGFINKALGIYRNLLSENPQNVNIRARIAELEGLDATSAAVAGSQDGFEIDPSEEEPELHQPFAGLEHNEPQVDLFATEAIVPVAAVASLAAVAFAAEDNIEKLVKDESDLEVFGDPSNTVPSSGTADNAISTLEGWLENIRRIRS